jgi:hypothetical protein
MLTVVGIWEPGFEEQHLFMEWRMWKQTIEAFKVDRWVMAGTGPSKAGRFEPYSKLRDALGSCPIDHQRVFCIPEHAEALDLQQLRRKVAALPNVTYVLGNVSENLKRYVTADDHVVSIHTPNPTDMFAACCLPMVLNA